MLLLESNVVKPSVPKTPKSFTYKPVNNCVHWLGVDFVLLPLCAWYQAAAARNSFNASSSNLPK